LNLWDICGAIQNLNQEVQKIILKLYALCVYKSAKVLFNSSHLNVNELKKCVLPNVLV